ncbi:aminodeoxychorismate synthase component I [Magnetospirillum molischianum]|uniref:aminodeoxychorismate synthase n=1 Tax=Magnetospirillum molischianum DSM 120 TaxID=1150626 RepID=H8FSS2_MAGML|nr:aminodeoxychorismate synthase component I [Magnetospirillum molischianum]CCG41410.1 Para-aminobenzoate synthase component 1 [Magnetospirillum molischianum DSM 120]
MSFLEIPYIDPVTAFSRWAETPWSMLLDSGGDDPNLGRYAYIAVNPYRTLICDSDGVRIDGQTVTGTDPFAILASELAAVPPSTEALPLPFAGGAVGMFGYELGRHIERAPVRHTVGQTEMAVGFYDVVAGFDRQARRAYVVAARPEAWMRAEALAAVLAVAPPLPSIVPGPFLRLRPELDRDAYLDRVRRIVELIGAGEVFQVNFTLRFLALRPKSLRPFDLYRRLKSLNPAPFAAFVHIGDDLTLVSASPERFLSLDCSGRIEARPIKGTRRRSADPGEDAALAAELVASEKDRAENLMIADLLRNDIGRVSVIGSVKVPSLRALESHATVHHLVSVVEGRLRADLGPVDLLRATFPGGSITGAPKVRAMEIIDELEPGPRGPYCGAVGWIGFDRAMDTSIVIRAVTLTRNQVIAQAGGGIVAESDPEAEYAEMMTKVAPALAALAGE